MKKKGGTAAGVPRSMGEAQSVTVSNGAPRDQVCDFGISSYLLVRMRICLFVSQCCIRNIRLWS